MQTSAQGLTQKQASERLARFGPNTIPEKPPVHAVTIFFSQLKNPLVYVLLLAMIVTIFIGDYQDSLIIALAVLINTVFGFVQEYRANSALSALKQMINHSATVIRDKKLMEISVSELVLGDLVLLKQGDKIGADGVLVSVSRFFVDEAALTGESIPVGKKVNEEIFAGTIVSAGVARMIVKKTAKDTEIGKIAQSVQEISFETPLRLQLARFSRQLLFFSLALTVFVFVLGLLSGKDLLEIFTTSVALSVSAIPEGLLVSLTVVLAIGMQRILKRRGLVRSLVSAETLGGVTTICSDKTGTLTMGKMAVAETVGDTKSLSLQAYLANDMDEPMVVAAFEWAKKNLSDKKEDLSHFKRIDSIPFSSEKRFFASLHENGGKRTIFVNGAPEYLLSWTKMNSLQKKKLLSQIESLTDSGYRLIGYARKSVVKDQSRIKDSDIGTDLEWVGMLAFLDPVREGVKSALLKTQSAGIKLIVITGDYPKTARFIMGQLGILVSDKATLLGEELEIFTEEELREKLRGEDRVILFARTSPNQKLKIIKALKENGEVVAMMGDGVNDAPALSMADIGIVVGDATDVAKESSDLVLLDSSFETIVASIEEGRGIFDNIRKIILYLLCDGFEEIVAVIISLFLGLPLPVTAAQILWINIVSDGLPNIALTLEPKRRNIMKEPPRSPGELLITPWMRSLIVIVSLSGGVLAMILFVFFYKETGDLSLSRSIAFAALGVNSLVYVFSVRELREPFWKHNIFGNMWLTLSVVVGFILQLVPFIVPQARVYFATSELSLSHWSFIFAASGIMFIIIETAKIVIKGNSFLKKEVMS